MRILFKFPIATLLSCSLLASGAPAQQQQIAAAYTAVSSVCADDGNGLGNRARCFQDLRPLLAQIQATTPANALPDEIGGIALAMVNAYNALNAPPAPVCAVMADAMSAIAQSGNDADQGAQILAIAEQMRSCAGFDTGAGRLLASPN